MKTIKDVKEKLTGLKIALKHATKQFQKYDNHDDMVEIELIRTRIESLEWVLE